MWLNDKICYLVTKQNNFQTKGTHKVKGSDSGGDETLRQVSVLLSWLQNQHVPYLPDCKSHFFPPSFAGHATCIFYKRVL